MERYIYKPGDEITINAKVVDVTASGNLIINISGTKCLVKPSDVCTVHPYQEPSKEDMRRGN